MNGTVRAVITSKAKVRRYGTLEISDKNGLPTVLMICTY